LISRNAVPTGILLAGPSRPMPSRGNAVRTWIIAAVLSSALAGAQAQRADFGKARPSAAAQTIADWVVDARDHKGLPFIIVDKPRARLWVFDAAGKLRGTSPVLLGLAKGDHTVPGIGDRALKDIRWYERTTPAGRYVGERGRNAHGDDIIWVDYDAAVSMHRVHGVDPGEHRLHRLATPTIADNRISYGCINVPVAFYDRVVDRTVTGSRVMIYVLPEVRPLSQVFAYYDVGKRAPRGAAP
jgi:hypothetical protein